MVMIAFHQNQTNTNIYQCQDCNNLLILIELTIHETECGDSEVINEYMSNIMGYI